MTHIPDARRRRDNGPQQKRKLHEPHLPAPQWRIISVGRQRKLSDPAAAARLFNRRYWHSEATERRKGLRWKVEVPCSPLPFDCNRRRSANIKRNESGNNHREENREEGERTSEPFRSSLLPTSTLAEGASVAVARGSNSREVAQLAEQKKLASPISRNEYRPLPSLPAAFDLELDASPSRATLATTDKAPSVFGEGCPSGVDSTHRPL
ncbi:hypothetical protein MRX96_010031 [Rhipicephalus microplus]